MVWRSLTTIPIDIDSGIGAARAAAIGQALERRAVPLLALRDGRAEPLASGALYVPSNGTARGPLLLVTCRHMFETGIALGDLGVPIDAAGGVLWLRNARARVLEHPLHDLVTIVIADARAAALLLRHWRAEPMVDAADLRHASAYVLAGYPYVQMRRIDSIVYARPVVLFACAVHVDAPELRLQYRHVAQRIDGLHIHAPALDGVSGATIWAVLDLADNGIDCRLAPAGVLSAFKPGAYARGEPWVTLTQLAAHAR
jgi:hypothetical protein